MNSVASHLHRTRASIVCVCVCGVLVIASIAGARRASAAEDDRACSAAYARAQERERGAHLLEARELLQTCAKASCGKVLYEACTAMFTQIEADIPSIVPVVTDGAGAPRVDVQVSIDGEPLAARIDGRAFRVDPGMHEFAFSMRDAVFATRKVLVVQGKHNRAISVAADASGRPVADKNAVVASAASEATHEPAAAPPEGTKLAAGNVVAEQQPRRGSLALTYTLASVGAVGIAGFGLMTEWGRRDNALLAQCSPFCPQASVTHVRRMYVAADVSLGVGIAAVVGAFWAYASSRSADEEHPGAQALQLDVRPTSSGAVAGVSGSFR
jgi:hypothetical protein